MHLPAATPAEEDSGPTAMHGEVSGRHPLAVAQFLNLRRQLPPMYLLLALNATALAYTHYAAAPRWLSIYTPAVLIGICLVRMAQWLAPVVAGDISEAFAHRVLRRTEWLSGILSAGFVSWALMLDQYGDAYGHGHVAVFVAITVMGCIFCLSYLPRAAHIVCYIVLGTFLTYCLLRGTISLTSMAANILLVGLVVLKVLNNSFDVFVALEESRGALETKQGQAQLLAAENARLAHSDPLTDLPNRRYFLAQLEAMLTQSADRAPFCIGVIDLDRFKPINDTHGHAQGDRLLQIIGARLRNACVDGVTVARLGGDEFGLIIERPVAEAQAIGQELCSIVQDPVHLGNIVVSVGCSGGLAEWPEAGTTAHGLFDCADFALYHAKESHRGTVVLFSTKLENMVRSEQALEVALQSADLDRELTIVYQPVVSTKTMQVAGLEVLARWHSPLIGPVPTELIFTTAERLGMARKVTLCLFDKVLADFAKVPRPVRVAFNLAATDIADPGTVAALLNRIERSGVAAQRLVFEITETSLIHDFTKAREALDRLRASGAQIALDDFGTGYSSLSSLHMLPIDFVKIDRSFAVRLDDPVGRRLVSAIRNLARSLDLECLFEGIETEMQMVEATLAGFHFVQGFHIARPQPLDDLLATMAQFSAPSSRTHAA